MGTYSVDRQTAELSLLSGGTTWVDLPVGAIIPYGGTTAPTGALICDGAEYLRADYPDLFAVIGTSFGTPSENTKFKVPDLRGNTLVGLNGEDTDFNAIGKAGGEKAHQLIVDELPSHSHTQEQHRHSTSLYGMSNANNGQSTGTVFSPMFTQVGSQSYNTDYQQPTINNTGNDEAHNNLQPYVTINYIIKASHAALPVDLAEDVEEYIDTLNVPDSPVTGNYVTAVSETSGKIAVTREVADAKPTESSNKMVKSGAVYDSEQDIYKANGILGAKNLIVPGLGWTSRTTHNLTLEVNDDGTFTFSSSSNIDAITWVGIAGNINSDYPLPVKAGDYILSCEGIPSGWTTNSYLGIFEEGNSAPLATVNSQTEGHQASVTLQSKSYFIGFRFPADVMPNFTIKPMLRLASDTDSTYQPFAKTNKQLTDDKAEQNAVFNVYGSKNIITNPYARESGYTTGGLTFTYDEDGIITVNGIYDNTTRQFTLHTPSLGSKSLGIIAGKKYILSFEIEGFSETTYGASIFLNINNSDVCAIRDATADGYYEVSFTLTSAQASSDTVVISTYYRADSELSEVTNATIKPMIRLADTDNTWVPFAKSNKQLTQDTAFNEYVEVLGAKNLIPYPYTSNVDGYPAAMGTQNFGDVTMTEKNGVLTFNGTATSSRNPCCLFAYPTGEGKYLPVENKKYIFTQGNESEFKGGCRITTRWQKADGSTYVFTANQAKLLIDNTDGTYVGIVNFSVWFNNETVLNNYVLKPMLRLASIEDDTYVPYAASNKKLTEEKVSYKHLGEVGAKNILKFPFYNMSGTHRGITFTAADDGSVGFTGTANDANPAQLLIEAKANFILKAGTYTLSDGGASDYGGMSIFFYNQDGTNYSGTYSGLLTNTSNNVYIMTTESGAQMNASNLYGYEKTFTIYSDAWVDIACRSATNVITSAVSGTIYPMLRRAEDTDSTYQPYAMTNQQLTKEVSALTAYHIRTLTRIDVKDYTAQNKYTATADGYVNFNGSAATESILNLDSIGLAASTSTSGRNALFVKKSMTIHFEGSTPTYAWFYPLD